MNTMMARTSLQGNRAPFRVASSPPKSNQIGFRSHPRKRSLQLRALEDDQDNKQSTDGPEQQQGTPLSGDLSDPTTSSPPPPPQQRGGDQEATSQQQEGKLSSSPPVQLQLPQSIVTRLRETVFSLDTLFVTSVENYGESGVLFKGNVRGNNPTATRNKLAARLKAEMGDSYNLFLLEDQDEKPVAVVIPAEAAEVQVSPVAEAVLAVLLGGTAVVTTLNVLGAELFNAALLTVKYDPELVSSAIPGTVAFLAILAAHEVGHIIGAKQAGLKLAPPIIVPAGLGLLGSFGAITRISSIVPNRQALATVTVPGPVAGFGASIVVLIAGLLLTAAGVGGIEVDSESFKDSLLVGGLGQLMFGDRLFSSAALNCNPAFVAGWAGLIINSINSIPAGELDGGRVFLSLFGRRAASRMSVVSFFLLGVLGFSSGLSLFWLLLVLTLQRGPILPCEEELSSVEEGPLRWACFAILILPLLVLLPYPGSYGDAGVSLPDLPPF